LRAVGLTLLILTLLLLSTAHAVSAPFRRDYSIEVSGNLYILDLEIRVRELGDYGVISIYLAPEGVYAYGVTVLKHPDEPKPHIYVMVGGQAMWFDAGFLEEDTLRFRIAVDRNLSRALAITPWFSRTYDLDFTPSIKRLSINVFNVTEREAPAPSLLVVFARVFVLNNTLTELTDQLYNLSSQVSTAAALSIENLEIGYTTEAKQQTPAPVETPHSTYTPRSVTSPETTTPPARRVAGAEATAVITALLIVGAAASLLIVAAYKRRRGSPGP